MHDKIINISRNKQNIYNAIFEAIVTMFCVTLIIDV